METCYKPGTDTAPPYTDNYLLNRCLLNEQMTIQRKIEYLKTNEYAENFHLYVFLTTEKEYIVYRMRLFLSTHFKYAAT